MGKKTEESRILNTKLKDSSSKIIFENNELCCQFLNDYVKLPYFKEVRPEDIEDVSSEFTSMFSAERYADRVKKIKIHIKIENTVKESTFFLISLVEHKTEVEYNIHMQIFRYMVYIWERYERDSEKRSPGCTRRRDFRYPPIIPIVYYEGRGRWTAPKQFKDKIMFGEQFEKYLPNFSYYIVPIYQYNNEMLLEHADEISLVMLINRMQTVEDIEEFRKLPAEKLDTILKDTPDYLLDIIAKVLRAFLLKENIPEEETEELVGKVKVRRMGELFANMEKMDIQAERRKTAEALKTLENGIKQFILLGKELGVSQEKMIEKIQDAYYMDKEAACEKVKCYW